MKHHLIPKRLGAWFLCFALLAGILPVTAGAATVGGFTIEGGTQGTDYSYSDGVLTINNGANLTISTNGQTSDRIAIASGATANITLAGVNITPSQATGSNQNPAIDVTGATPNLTLQGTNSLTGGTPNEYQYGAPGIQVPSGATLTIDGTGSLTATGTDSCAGIGGGYKGNGGAITIHGGEVKATGGANGAGIGGGYSGDGGTITISGDTVTAIGGSSGAGIGGGNGETGGGSGGTIKITGGTVKAKSAGSGAGIGGGNEGSGGNIVITGGTVTANGGDHSTNTYGSAGIGNGGSYSSTVTGSFSFTTNDEGTSGTAVIYATGGSASSGPGAGIGTSGTSGWSGIIFQGNEGTVYGDQTITDDFTLDNDQTLTVPSGSKLTIEEDVTFTGGITVESGGTLENSGTVTDGITNNGGTVKNRSTISIRVSSGESTVTSAKLGSTVSITADISQASSNALTRAAANQVEFFVGTGNSKKPLGTAAVSNNTATLSNVSITTEKGWSLGENTITAEYGGGTGLLGNSGTATLTVTAAQLDAPTNLAWSITPGQAT